MNVTEDESPSSASNATCTSESDLGNTMRVSSLRAVFCLSILSIVTTWGWAQESTTGFAEKFALSKNRKEVLKELIPGTRDFYFYSCLERQQAQDWGQVEELVKNWVQRYGRNGRVEEIENRQALLKFSTDPEATWEFLERRLQLKFNHQPTVSDRDRALPTSLDPELISLSAWTKRALSQYPGTLNGIRPEGIWSLTTGRISDDLLVQLLKRLKTSDVPNLPALVIRALKITKSNSFSNLSVSEVLTLAQLDECIKLRPSLLQDNSFVEAYIRRLAPSADVESMYDLVEKEKHLERLQSFTDRLTSSQNSLKAQVLYNRLKHDMHRGRFNKERFLAYLRLPQNCSYGNREFFDKPSNRDIRVDRGRDVLLSFDAIDEGDQVIRAHLEHFFVSEDSISPYSDFIDSRYLKRVLAETKILAGIGDMERWYSLLDNASYYEQLKNRVEINLAPTNKVHLAPTDAVKIAADIKNVSTLLVKIYEINTTNFYADQGKEIDASIQIDGLVASEEMTFEFEESPLRRVRRNFDFPKLMGPGVWVIDFIGNGISSRAVVAKGKLKCQERLGSAGHVFRILDENGKHLPKATIKFGSRLFKASENGEIHIPYSTKRGSKNIILMHGGQSTLDTFYHRTERYRLTAATYIRQESLVAGANAKVVIRPILYVNGKAISLSLLKSNLLTIRSVDQFGVASTIQERDIKLSDGEEIVHTIRVPQNFHTLSVQFSGKVQQLTKQKELNLTASAARFSANGINRTNETRSVFLTRDPSGYEIQVLGRNGEPIADASLSLFLEHSYFRRAFETMVKTDKLGRVALGMLPGIESVSTKHLHAKNQNWDLTKSATRYPSMIHASSGETIRLSYVGDANEATASSFALFELRNDHPYRNCAENLSLSGGFLELKNLTPGDYDLTLKNEARRVRVRVSSGTREQGWSVNPERMMELSSLSPLTIQSTRIDGDNLKIQCRNSGKETRLHVLTTHYLPANRPFSSLASQMMASLGMAEVAVAENSFNSGLIISDEYRYILDRRFAQKFPGNMLVRPEILLNPWGIDQANETIGLGGGAGGRFGGIRAGRAGGGAAPSGSPSAPKLNPILFANLGFMGIPSPILVNLRPDENGLLTIPLKDLGTGHIIQVLAVDGEEHVYTTTLRERQEIIPIDQRLQNGLDSTKNYTQQQSIDLVRAGETVTLEDLSMSRAESFASLQDVFDVFQTLNPNQGLEQFAFLMTWPKLEPKQKESLYATHACHELNFFLHQKDPAFFKSTIEPYLSNKARMTFLDHWLLGHDLADFLVPWAYSQLNIVEKLLLLKKVESDLSARGRFARDLFDLIPATFGTDSALFATVLGNKSLAPLEKRANFFSSEDKSPVRRKRKVETARRSEIERYVAPKKNSPTLESNDDDVSDPSEIEEMAKFKESAGRHLAKDRDEDRKIRQQMQGFYRAVEATRRFAEHNYWHRRVEETTSSMIGMNGFWLDFAENKNADSFVSSKFFEATGSFAEMLMALSVLDLPFVANEHETSVEGGKARLTAKSSLLLVREEIAESQPSTEEQSIIVSQSYFRADDPFFYVGQEKRHKNVKDEFLTGVVYGCRVVLTNPTPNRMNVSLLTQIPLGAIPTNNGKATQNKSFTLNGYRTNTSTSYFYFPDVGSFRQFPANVSALGKSLIAAKAQTLKVVKVLSKSDAKSWDYVSQKSSHDEVLAFLRENNLRRLDFGLIAWRFKDIQFFRSVVTILGDRYHYDDVVWSYGIKHRDTKTASVFLSHKPGFIARCGSYLESPLLSIDPVARKTYQHVEYAPLINSRAHQFGSSRKIENKSLGQQFASLMSVLRYRNELNAQDWFQITYYFLLQDRIEDALKAAAMIDPKNLGSQLQYDYLRAYLDFFSDDRLIARTIAERHQDHANPRWRAKFQSIIEQLDEAEGKVNTAADDTNSKATQDKLAAKQPALDLTVEARDLVIAHENLKDCRISYFEMDIEFLFSTNPFVRNDSGSFAFVRPNLQHNVALDPTSKKHILALPEKYRNSNLLVEVRAAGIVKRQTVFANSLQVRMRENYGQLQVVHGESSKPLPKVYVKVFAREKNGEIRFHKDGYTDLRGRFDYASLSGPKGSNVKRFSILLMSENDGAMVREVAAPTQ